MPKGPPKGQGPTVSGARLGPGSNGPRSSVGHYGVGLFACAVWVGRWVLL